MSRAVTTFYWLRKNLSNIKQYVNMKGAAPFSPADSFADPEADAAWDSEIRDRILSIDEGRVTGVAFEDVMRAADKHLAR